MKTSGGQGPRGSGVVFQKTLFSLLACCSVGVSDFESTMDTQQFRTNNAKAVVRSRVVLWVTASFETCPLSHSDDCERSRWCPLISFRSPRSKVHASPKYFTVGCPRPPWATIPRVYIYPTYITGLRGQDLYLFKRRTILYSSSWLRFSQM